MILTVCLLHTYVERVERTEIGRKNETDSNIFANLINKLGDFKSSFYCFNKLLTIVNTFRTEN